MSPAQRRKRFKRFKSHKRGFRFLRVVLVLGIFLLLTLFISLQTKFWDGETKVVSAISQKDGDVLVSVFDPEAESITNIVIPGSTQLSVARNLGTFRLKSIWQLGANEKVGGRLLAETITKNFHFPVTNWGDGNLAGISQTSFPAIIKGIFTPAKTNLKIGDRLKMGLFSLGVKNPKRININLKEGNTLRKTKLIDGEEGYLLIEANLRSFYPIFSENVISRQNLRVQIIDHTGSGGIADQVGQTLEVLGVKVASLEREEKDEEDCSFRTEDEILAKKVSAIFSCRKEKEKVEGNFDLTIRLGSEFARRY
jgi:hypothetical protein